MMMVSGDAPQQGNNMLSFMDRGTEQSVKLCRFEGNIRFHFTGIVAVSIVCQRGNSSLRQIRFEVLGILDY